MNLTRRVWRNRTGGVYIAVLGTALIVSLLGLSALVGQRIQNRIVTAAADIRQAQLNANTAVELALLIMKQESNWRTNRANGNWFTNRGTSAGTCSVNVTDPIDANLANDADDPVIVLGIGYSGQAEQRTKVTIDPRQEPLSSLRSAIAAGDVINLSGDTLRTGGLISANTVTASSSQVYGDVEAVAISGSTYSGITTQIDSADRPTMPDWASVFQYYLDNGTEINVNNLPTADQFEFGRNLSFNTNLDHWDTDPPGLPIATFAGPVGFSGHVACLRVDRDDKKAGAGNRLQVGLLKPSTTYQVTIEVHPDLSLLQSNWFNVFMITEYADGSFVQSPGSTTPISWLSNVWTTLSASITTPAWTEEPTNIYLVVNSNHASGNNYRFYVDNLHVYENVTGRMLYRQVLSPSINPFGAQTNSQGIYWINCNNQRLVIERSRIVGTLLIINPGPDSCIANGPIHWSPAVAGYPALLVDADTAISADFAINAINRGLSEKENGIDYNLDGTTGNYIYSSEIRGLVAIEDDLTYQNRPLIRGQVIVGDDIKDSSGELEVEFQPESLLNPPPGFLAPYSHQRRPVSAFKAVLP